MEINRNHINLFLLLCAIVLFASCVSIKPYQRIYLNDAEMIGGSMHTEIFELNAMNYREASVSGFKGKTSGGCGCN